MRGPTARRGINIPMSDQAPRETRTGTYGTGGALTLLILYNIHNTATDQRYAMLNSSTPSVKKLTLLTTRFCGFRCVSAAEHQIAEQLVLQNQQDKTQKASLREYLSNTLYNFHNIPSL